jgi:hypothetical protein
MDRLFDTLRPTSGLAGHARGRMSRKVSRSWRFATFVPAITAFLLILSGPFVMAVQTSVPNHGGLICYCCSGTKPDCPTFSCPGCHRGDNHAPPVWVPEPVLLSTPALMVQISMVYVRTKGSCPFDAIYLDVPVRPPLAFPISKNQ